MVAKCVLPTVITHMENLVLCLKVEMLQKFQSHAWSTTKAQMPQWEILSQMVIEY